MESRVFLNEISTAPYFLKKLLTPSSTETSFLIRNNSPSDIVARSFLESEAKGVSHIGVFPGTLLILVTTLTNSIVFSQLSPKGAVLLDGDRLESCETGAVI